MKPYRKEKLDKTEFQRLLEIGKDYHKFLFTKFGRRIKTNRLHKK